MEEVIVYTDGSCYKVTGVGGYAGIVVDGKKTTLQVVGAEENTTTQRMELMAAIQILMALKEPCHVKLHSDSRYLVESFNQQWVYQWEDENFKLADGTDRANSDLWIQLLKLSRFHNVTFIKVKGHSGIKWNEKCDWLAGSARIKLEKEL